MLHAVVLSLGSSVMFGVNDGVFAGLIVGVGCMLGSTIWKSCGTDGGRFRGIAV